GAGDRPRAGCASSRRSRARVLRARSRRTHAGAPAHRNARAAVDHASRRPDGAPPRAVRAAGGARPLDHELARPHPHADWRAPDELLTHLTGLLVDDPPATARDGGAVRPGADGELDDLLTAGADARVFIGALEARERERTGIRSLRLGYNRVFGYYIDIPNA